MIDLTIAKEKAIEYQANEPFPNIVLKNLFPDNFLNNVVQDIKHVEASRKVKFHKMCTTGNDFSAFNSDTRKLMKYLTSTEWVKFISELTNIPGLVADTSWHGAGINHEPRGAHLELHTDFNQTSSVNGWRRVNVLLFLSKDWQDEWGGQNELWNADLTQCVKSTNPEFNTLVVFSTSNISWHGFTPVTCPKDRARKVISCYYYHPTDKGPHTKSQGSTNYVGWGKGRDTDAPEIFKGRHGTGFKSI